MAPRSIAADAVVAGSPAQVFAFLSDLRNHWRLESGFVELDGLHDDGKGGRVRMVGPFRIGRVATTRVIAAEPESTVRGTAELSGGTRAAVRWDIAPHGRGSHVTLAATVEHAAPLDRLLLALGGTRWLERTFASALRRLGDVVTPD